MKLRDFLQWGEQALAQHDYELSEEIARHLLRQSPSNLAARALLGRIYLKSGQLEQAEEQLLQALDMDPENVEILTSLADLLETLGKDAARLGILRRAFECDPTLTDVKQQMIAIERESGGGGRGNGFLTRTGLARTHLRSGLLEHAIAEFRQLFKESQVHWSAQVALMEAYWLNGNRQGTSRLADEIVREHPNCLKAILLSADVRAHMGLIDQARQLFERARQVDPDFTLARVLYPANGPSRLPLPSDDAEIDVPIDLLQKIEAALAAMNETRTTGAQRRATARVNARSRADSRDDETRVLVTPAPRGSSSRRGREAAPSPTAPQTDSDVGEDKQDSESWDSLLLKLEREGSQLDEAALDAMARQLEAMAENAGNKLQAWQQLGDVYQRIEQTDRAMRAYMRALESNRPQ